MDTWTPEASFIELLLVAVVVVVEVEPALNRPLLEAVVVVLFIVPSYLISALDLFLLLRSLSLSVYIISVKRAHKSRRFCAEKSNEYINSFI